MLSHSIQVQTRLNPIFASYVDTFDAKINALLQSAIFRCDNLPDDLPERVVYCLFENGSPLYVGRTDHFTNRLKQHCARKAPPNHAALAFKLAKECHKERYPKYAGSNTQNGLMEECSFRVCFAIAKARVAQMRVRYVKESNDPEQALLEIYCSVALGTVGKYNSFQTS